MSDLVRSIQPKPDMLWMISWGRSGTAADRAAARWARQQGRPPGLIQTLPRCVPQRMSTTTSAAPGPALIWFREELRLADNRALQAAIV